MITVAFSCSVAQFQGTAVLKGSIQDSTAHPVAAVTVALETATETPVVTSKTDSDGAYRFPAVSAGTYRLRAGMAGYQSTISSFFTLKPDETKTLDLILSREPKASSQAPEFFDEPQFTVAGVTDTTNLGTHGADTVVRTTESLVRDTASLGKTRTGVPLDASATKELSLRKAVQSEPENFEANRSLGKVLLDSGKPKEAAPYLERATQLKPTDDQAAYDLAAACASIGEYGHAQSMLQTLLTRGENTDAHRLLGDVDEKLGKPVEAAREYQRAAELLPSEENLFDWASELLLHRAFEPADEVFTKGNRLFPASARMLVGLGVTLYARGSYELAVRRLVEASDLDPDSSTPYIFLGKIQTIEKAEYQEVTNRLARFARLQPDNALANYYYATSLWKARRGPEDAEKFGEIESLLRKAVQLDSQLGPGFLQLGILYEEQRKLPLALSAYQQAVAVSPNLDQGHYRLSQAYRRSGEGAKAKAELELYQITSKQAVEQAEREQREIQGFVYTLRDKTSVPQPQQRPATDQ